MGAGRGEGRAIAGCYLMIACTPAWMQATYETAEHPSATDHNAFRAIRNQQVAGSILAVARPLKEGLQVKNAALVDRSGRFVLVSRHSDAQRPGFFNQLP
jgi:hypothetical protein